MVGSLFTGEFDMHDLTSETVAKFCRNLQK